MASLRAVLAKKKVFRARLLRWYDAHRRELPWRGTRDPYRIWVSEIMLQQTRVNAVLGHYRRFLESYPNVKELATAEEADVLAAWSGLGYYRRARMMRSAAQIVVAEHGGKFPASATELQQLPGIGRYTAAAIASMAHDEPRAVVDGNVERVVGRIAGKTLPQKSLWDLVQSVITEKRPGDFNQAMMELGAMVCTPQAPLCRKCPVRTFCATQGKEATTDGRKARRVAQTHYLFSQKRGKVLLAQRKKDASLMAGMWELPPVRPRRMKPLLKVRHTITTTNYEVFIHADAAGAVRGEWIELRKVATLPLTGLARKVLTRLGAIASPA